MDSALQQLKSFRYDNLGIDRFTFLKLTAFSVVSATGIYLGKIWLSYRYFDQIGVKTPPYHYITGHLDQLMKHKNDSAQCQKWTKEYGKTYGLIHNQIQYLFI